MVGACLFYLTADEANLLHKAAHGKEVAVIPAFTAQNIGREIDDTNEEIETYWMLEYRILTNEYIERYLK